jgi:GTP-binding protein
MDLPEAEAGAMQLAEQVERDGRAFFRISAATGDGVRQVLYSAFTALQEIRTAEATEQTEEVIITPPSRRPPKAIAMRQFSVRQDGDVFVVEGEGLAKFMERLDISNPATMRYLQKLFGDIGIHKALRAAGVKNGDTVSVLGLEFEYME